MPTNFLVRLPVANVFKFTVEGEDTSERAQFDQRRYFDSNHATVEARPYFELWEKDKSFKIQIHTNFPAVWAQVVNCNGNTLGDVMVGSMIKQYRGKHYYTTCQFSTINGKLFIFFRNETQYSDSDWETEVSQTNFGGKLPPIEADAGDQVRFVLASNEIVSTIIERAWSPELLAEGYIVDHDITLLSVESGAVDVNYNERPTDLWEISGSMSAIPTGLVYIRLRMGLDQSSHVVSYLSEPIDLQVKHDEVLPILFRHNGDYMQSDVWNFEYAPGWYSTLMVPANMYQFVVAGELETDMNDFGIQRKTRAVPYRQLQFNIMNIPGWIMDKLMIIFSHDTILINGNLWEIDNYGQFENIQQVDMGTLQINLRMKDDRTLFEREFEQDLTAEFTPSSKTVPYTEGTHDFVFNTNTGQTFSFINLPAWISVVGGNSFEDGDTVQLEITENEATIERGVILFAQSSAFGNTVQATIDIDQEFDDSIEEYITAGANAVALWGTAESESPPITVSASGPYDVEQLGDHQTWIVNNSGSTPITIESDADNNTTSNRTGTVRLYLISNPSIYFDIAVVQQPIDDLYSVSPGFIYPPAYLPPGGQEYLFNVSARVGSQWQASSLQSGPPATGLNDWLHFDKTIQTGPKAAFSVLVDAKPPYVPNRIGTITLVNINNSADTLTITVTQND